MTTMYTNFHSKSKHRKMLD